MHIIWNFQMDYSGGGGGGWNDILTYGEKMHMAEKVENHCIKHVSVPWLKQHLGSPAVVG